MSECGGIFTNNDSVVLRIVIYIAVFQLDIIMDNNETRNCFLNFRSCARRMFDRVDIFFLIQKVMT